MWGMGLAKSPRGLDGGWSCKLLRVMSGTPMIIPTGVLALRADKRSVSVRAAPILAAARCPGYWWECRTSARDSLTRSLAWPLLPPSLRPRQHLTGLALSGARQH